jgi:23S rRNA pseudouridine2605 synthase
VQRFKENPMKKFFKKEIKETGDGKKGVLKSLSQDSRRRQGNDDAREKYAKRRASDKPYAKDSERKPYERTAPRKSFEDRGNESPSRSYGSNRDERPRRSGDDRGERKPYERSAPRKSFGDGDDRPKRTYGSNDDTLRGPQGTRGERKPYERSAPRSSSYGDRPPRRDADDRTERKPYDRSAPRSSSYGDRPPRRDTDDRTERKPYDRSAPRSSSYGDKPPRRDTDDRTERKPYDRSAPRSSSYGDRPPRRDADDRTERKPYDRSAPRSSSYGDRPPRRGSDDRDERPKRNFEDKAPRSSRSFGDSTDRKPYERKAAGTYRGVDKSGPKRFSKNTDTKRTYSKKADDGLIRLNKYLGNAGIASRREADELIKTGVVTVNGVVITEMGHKVNADDVVLFGGDRIRNEKKVYVLLNKPKDYITTTEDEKGRRTVMELLDGIKENIFPVGRLDRNTTGLLLFTNDGDLANMLTHPKFGVKKIYSVELNKNLKTEDYKKIHEGLELEDGIIKVDNMSFVGDSKKEVGIEIHSGRNRIVRRIFETLGYEVLKLDRVGFAGLSKKDLPRGKFRFLTEKEVGFLRMIG